RARRLAAALLALGLVLVRLRTIVSDIEARALEQQPGAAGGNAHRLRPALGAPLRCVVLDAVEQLEYVSAFRAAVIVSWHPWSPEVRRESASRPARSARMRSSRRRRRRPRCSRATGRCPGARAP